MVSSKLDAEELRDLMESLWARLDSIIKAQGGTVEKHIGDAIMAIFGAHQAREDDPERAVRCALAMQACLSEHHSGGPPAAMPMRIGIHTGVVVLGPLGTTGEFAATGDTVNIANRLEQHAPVGGVIISQETYRQVYGLFNVQSLPPLTVKGKSEMLQTHLVLSPRPRSLARTLRGVEGVPTQMIGREPELTRLQRAFRTVMEECAGQIFTVVGEAGIGKSCLAREFQKWVEGIPENARLFCGRAAAEMAGLPFSLMRDVFSSRFEIQESDPVAMAREKFERGMLDLLTTARGTPAKENLQQVHFVGQMLGLDFSASPYLGDLLKDPEQIRHRAFYYLSELFAAISHGPSAVTVTAVNALLLIVEDIHWSDDGSLDLLEHLARSCRDVPLMVVCLARPTLFERRSSWGEGLRGHTRLTLDSLSRPESHALVDSILRKASQIPQALRELIVGGAEGNPFYIEEIIKMLIDQKVIVPGPDEWRIEEARLAVARVPATLTGVLQARLDGLTPLERGVLQRASVIGRVFWDSALERLSPAARASAVAENTFCKRDVLEALAGLRRKELIYQRESSAFAGSVEYTFKHELLRSVTYESLLKKSRREHHAQVAGWLIDSSGERIGEFTGLVAAHFEQAGQPGQAAEWYGKAGLQARASYAQVMAIENLKKALTMLPPERAEEKSFQTKQMEWQDGLGAALGTQARFAEAKETYARMRALAEARKDVVAQARAGNGLAFVHERLGDIRASVEAADQARLLAQSAGDSGTQEQIRALHLKGWAFYRLGDAAAVLALGEQILKLCTEVGDRRGMATGFKLHGVAHLQLGHYLEADRYFKQSLALCLEQDDRRNLAAMWSNLGESARLRGDYQAATELYQKALTIARQTDNRESEIIYLNNLGGARLGLREFEQSEADLRQVIALASWKSFALSETYNFLSEACLGQGKLPEALDAARHALELAKQSEIYLDQGGAWRALGQAASRLFRSSGGSGASIDDPDACFSESLRVFNGMNAEGEQARTLRAWAEFELHQGRTEAGRKKLEQARGIFLRLGMVSEAQITEALF
jgi:predicted ATPase/class 3 adenylate cyclase